MINQFVKLVTGTGMGTIATVLNLRVSNKTVFDAVDFHLTLINGFLGIVVAGFTLVFLYYQICKIKKDLRSKK